MPLLNKQKIYIIVPAFNEADRIRQVLKDIKAEGFENIVVVNDGSKDETEKIAMEEGVIILSHCINRGPGAATQTGLSYAKKQDADFVVTIDADGQHDARDISRLVEKAEMENLDMVFGSRFLEKSNSIPFTKRFFNEIADIVTFMLSTKWVSDSQTGLKVFSKHALDKIYINTSGFEFCTEIFMQIRYYNLKYGELPIKVNYNEHTQKKGQNFATGITTLFKLFVEAITK